MICLGTYKTHCLQLISTNFRTIVIQFFQLNLEKPVILTLRAGCILKAIKCKNY